MMSQNSSSSESLEIAGVLLLISTADFHVYSDKYNGEPNACPQGLTHIDGANKQGQPKLHP